MKRIRVKGAGLALGGALLVALSLSPWPAASIFAWAGVPVAVALGWWLTPAALDYRRRASATAIWFGVSGSILLVALLFGTLMITAVWGRPLNSAETPATFGYFLLISVVAYAPLVVIPMLAFGALWVMASRRLLKEQPTR